jgi:indolepyruvate ferredoxin oxidoreductase
VLVTGVGGTGVDTLSAVIGQAAHLENKGFGSIDMTGLAQKGGAVACHMRVAKDADQIHAIRAGVAGADLVLGCDLVVTASNKVLETVKPDQEALLKWLDDQSVHPGFLGHRELAKQIFRDLGIFDEQSPTCQLEVP